MEGSTAAAAAHAGTVAGCGGNFILAGAFPATAGRGGGIATFADLDAGGGRKRVAGIFGTELLGFAGTGAGGGIPLIFAALAFRVAFGLATAPSSCSPSSVTSELDLFAGGMTPETTQGDRGQLA